MWTFALPAASDSGQTGRASRRPAAPAIAVRLALAALCLLAMVVLARQLAVPDDPSAVVLRRYSPSAFMYLLAASYALGWGVYCALARQPLRKQLMNCGLATGALGLTLGVLEIPALVGLADYRLLLAPAGAATFGGVRKAWEDPRNRFDRELMYTRRPGYRIAGETTGDLVYWLGIAAPRRYQVDVRYDRNGFRNEREIKQAAMVLIGDSFLEAGLVAEAALVSSRLRQLLGVEVANLGLSGYGPQQELLVLRRYGLPLRPQVAVWFFFEGNDLLDVERYRQFARHSAEYVQELDRFANRSFTKQTILALGRLTTSNGISDGAEAQRRSCRLRHPYDEEARTLYFGFAAAPLSPAELASLEIAQHQLLEAQRLSAASGTTLLLAYVPTKFRVYGELCDFAEDAYPRAWTLNDLPVRLEGWARANDIAYVDLTAPLKQAAANGALTYFADDGHWSATGHEVVAKTIAGTIATQVALKSPQ
ncbi:MAG: hypothetical protein HY699_12730 [Deltaproteobacteria bacterium]|nr:hypothetical protein [Deltaproteobacteria bacterium]